MRPRLLLGVIAVICCGTAPAEAALTWDATTQEVTAQIGDMRCEVVYVFHNREHQPVTMLDAQANCDCTTATVERRRYQPGESGEVRATFVFGESVGLQRKEIFVTTSDDPTHPTTLSLRVMIPEIAELFPRILPVDSTAPDAPHFFTVRLNRKAKASIRSVTSDLAAMKITLQQCEDDSTFRVMLAPPRPAKPQAVEVRVLVEAAGRTISFPMTAILR